MRKSRRVDQQFEDVLIRIEVFHYVNYIFISTNTAILHANSSWIKNSFYFTEKKTRIHCLSNGCSNWLHKLVCQWKFLYIWKILWAISIIKSATFNKFNDFAWVWKHSIIWQLSYSCENSLRMILFMKNVTLVVNDKHQMLNVTGKATCFFAVDSV